MTISFPRALPTDFPVVGMTFMPEPMAAQTPLRSGKRIALDIGPTLWRGKWQLAEVEAEQAGIIRAWYDTLLSYESFLAYDVLRQYPLHYVGGFGGLVVGSNAFDGTCTLADVATNAVEVDLEDLPVGFVLAPGDYFDFDYGDSHALHRVVTGGVADGSGDLTVEVRPPIRPGWDGDAPVSVNFYRAAAEMTIVSGSWSEQTVPPARVSFSFEAIQTL